MLYFIARITSLQETKLFVSVSLTDVPNGPAHTEVVVTAVQHSRLHGPAVAATGVWLPGPSGERGAGQDEPATRHQVGPYRHVQGQLHLSGVNTFTQLT